MGYRDDAAKADLLAAAAKSIDSTAFGELSDEDISSLVQTYFRHIALEDLVDRSPAEIATDVAKHLRVAAKRPQGTAVIRVRTPDPRPDGEALPSVIEIVTDDMPFIVDSVTMEVSRSGHAIQLVIHPQILARRDVTGALRGLALADGRRPATDQAARSSRSRGCGSRSIGSPTPTAGARWRSGCITSCGTSARRSRTGRRCGPPRSTVADEITETPPKGLPDDEVDETVELLRWLADNHFTFLGYREYQLVDKGGGPAISAVPGHRTRHPPGRLARCHGARGHAKRGTHEGP